MTHPPLRRDAEVADVELRVTALGEGRHSADMTVVWQRRRVALASNIPIALRESALLELANDPAVYGAALTAMVFSPALREAWARVRARSDSLGAPVRLSLSLDPADQTLQLLRWELLRDPGDQTELGASERVRLARSLSSRHFEPARRPPPGLLRAVVAVAGVGPPGAAPINVAAFADGAAEAIGDGGCTLLDGRDGRPAATLEAIVGALRGGAPVLYLVCHSTLADGAPHLWLEGSGGPYRPVPGAQLLERLQGLERWPALVVLATCHGGVGEAEALAALGPRLAAAGVPAVLGLRGAAPQPVVAAMMPVFFRELRRDGAIDRAVATARATLADPGARAMPILWLQDLDGRLWGPAPEGAAAYDVRDLRDENPYMGLRPFTFAERERYGGRAELVSAVVAALTDAGRAPELLFLTGASGSGKSSFAQAALLPALERAYGRRGLPLRHAVIRPGGRPLAALADGLAALGDPAGWAELHRGLADPAAAPAAARASVARLLGAGAAVAIVFDQFEELFTQTSADERAAMLAAVEAIARVGPPLSAIATMRDDYLPELFAYPSLFAGVKGGFELRAMDAEELRAAIQRPLLSVVPNGERRFEPALLDALVHDAGQDVAYLPLLQVTLDDLWRRGALTRGAYTSLTDAISRQADRWLRFADADSARPRPRDPAEQTLMRDLLLSLVAVGDDGAGLRVVRRRATMAELAGDDGRVRPLVYELVRARLLSIRTETRDGAPVEVVDLIHESLIANWAWLARAVEEQRDLLVKRRRLRLLFEDWRQRGQPESDLLAGSALAEAEELLRAGDRATTDPVVRAFLGRSIARRDAETRRREEERERELARARELEAEQRARADAEESKAAVEHEAARQLARRNRVLQGMIVLAVAIAALAGFLAFLADQRTREASASRAEADRRTLAAEAGAVVAQSQAALDAYPQRSLLLAVEALRLRDEAGVPVPAADEALRAALARAGGRGYADHATAISAVAVSPRGDLVASGGAAEVRLWDLVGGALAPRATVPLRPFGSIFGESVPGLHFSPDGRWLTATHTGLSMGLLPQRAYLIDTVTGVTQELLSVSDETLTVTYSPDGRWLLVGGPNSQQSLWRLGDAGAERALLVPAAGVAPAAMSASGRWLAIGASPRSTRLWDLRGPLDTWVRLDVGAGALAFSPDERYLAVGTVDRRLLVWDLVGAPPPAPPLADVTLEHTPAALAFSPDGATLALVDQRPDYRSSQMSLWDVGAAEPRAAFELQAFRPLISFTPDGTRLIAEIRNTVVPEALIWEVGAATGDAPVRLDGLTGRLSVTPDGRRLIAPVGSDLALLEFGDGQPAGDRATLRGHDLPTRAAAFSPDGRWLVSGGDDKVVRLWDLSRAPETTAAPLTLRAPEEMGRTTALSYDGRYALLLGTQRSDRETDTLLWDLEEPAAPRRLSGAATAIAAASRDGRWLLIIDPEAGDRGRLWDTARLPPERRPLLLYADPDTISCSPSYPGPQIYAVVLDESGASWWTPEGEPALTVRGYISARGSVLSPDGRWLAAGDDAGVLRLWDLGAPGAPPVEHPMGAVALDVAFSPDGATLAALTMDHTLLVWSVEDAARGAQPRVLEGQERLSWLAFDARGGLTAVACARAVGGMEAARWDLADENAAPVVTTPGEDLIRSVAALSPDGRYLALGFWVGYPTGGLDPGAAAESFRTVTVYDLWARGSAPPITLRDDGAINDVTFSPDGAWAITVSAGGVLRHWPLAAASPSAERWSLSMPHSLQDVAVSADGQRLVTTGRVGLTESFGGANRLLVWPLTTEQLVAEACVVAGRNLTADEWRQALGERPYERTCPDQPLHPDIQAQAASRLTDPAEVEARLAILDRLDPDAAAAARRQREADALYDDLQPRIREASDSADLAPLLTEVRALPPERRAEMVTRVALGIYTLERVTPDEALDLVALVEEARPDALLPNFGVALLEKGAEAFQAGEPEVALRLIEAGQAFGARLEARPGMWAYLCRVGAAYGKPAEVMPLCEQAVSTGRLHYDGYEARAIARALTGDGADAREDFGRALELRRDMGAPADTTARVARWAEALAAGATPFAADELRAALPQYWP